MLFIYLVFTVVIFVLEPLVLHKWFEEQASTNPQRVLGLVFKAHIVLITLSFLTIAAAVIGVHG